MYFSGFLEYLRKIRTFLVFCRDLSMAGSGLKKRRRRRLHLSKLYTLTCTQAFFKQDHSQIGGPGYSRLVFINEPDSPEADTSSYSDNYVRTTKYTLATFLPKSLFEQFRRVANFYFLVTGVLSFTPLAPYTAASAIFPLLFVIGATMVKEGVEDWRRNKQVYTSLILFFLSNLMVYRRLLFRPNRFFEHLNQLFKNRIESQFTD